MSTYSIRESMSYGNLHQIKSAGESFLRETPDQSIEFSLTHVTRFDLAALALMLGWMRFAEAENKTLRFVDIPASLSKMANIFGVGVIIG